MKEKLKKISLFIDSNPGLSSSKIHQSIDLGVELVTVKRYLAKLVSNNFVIIQR